MFIFNMQILYVYDFRYNTERKRFNRNKRMFYYYLNQQFRNAVRWKTRSVFLLDAKHEKEMDRLFDRFHTCLIVYKSTVRQMRRVH